MFQQDLKYVPADVVFVLSIQMMSQPIGMDTYNLVQKIINGNPKYFPWEHKYKSIPKEVHEAFEIECYPERFKTLEWTNKGDEQKSLWQLIEENITLSYFPSTNKDANKKLEKYFDEIKNRRQDKVNEQNRIKSIWDKHYKKYKLECREF